MAVLKEIASIPLNIVENWKWNLSAYTHPACKVTLYCAKLLVLTSFWCMNGVLFTFYTGILIYFTVQDSTSSQGLNQSLISLD